MPRPKLKKSFSEWIFGEIILQILCLVLMFIVLPWGFSHLFPLVETGSYLESFFFGVFLLLEGTLYKKLPIDLIPDWFGIIGKFDDMLLGSIPQIVGWVIMLHSCWKLLSGFTEGVGKVAF